jgi:protein O-GlcNAc transferase
MRSDVVDEAIQIALRFQEEGRFAEAEQTYRAALEQDPSWALGWQSLGTVLMETDQMEAAASAFGKAVTLDPDFAAAHDGLGVALMESGQPEAAIAAWRRVVELRSDDAEARQNLALGLRHIGRIDEAVTVWGEAVALEPEVPELLVGFGNLLRESGQIDEANAAYARAAALVAQQGGAEPPGATTAPGPSPHREQAIDTIVSAFSRATEVDPALAGRQDGPGTDPQHLESWDQAMAALATAVELDPGDAIARSNLGTALLGSGKIDEAIAAFETAIGIRPDLPVTHNNLGIALRECGRLAEAIASYDRAIALDPEYGTAHASRLFALHGDPEYDATRLLAEHRAWNERFARPLPREPHRAPGAEDRAPDRRLRIGYVSPDLRKHPVGFFLLPLFEAHDRRLFDLTCYTDVRFPDELTRRLQGHVTNWRSTARLSDAEVAAQIREDRIDILVDLAMHSAGNRLRVFARKPAPVQVTYLAYCSTTGLDAIDWRITDPFLDPPEDGDSETLYAERSLRLGHSCYWCYQPPIDTDCPGVGPLPALDGGRTTFGCLNDFSKIGRPLLETWCRLLAMVPRSQLVLHAPPGSAREGARAVFAQAGVDPGRLQFLDRVPLAQYLAAHGNIDVALDPFPYGGGRTTCDALWMGVPVVSLTGRTAVGRGGTGILSNLGLSELVARTADEYVAIAARLGTDLPRLAQLRSGLRQRMERSPLMDRAGFARAMEAAYRQMWREYCGG